VLAARPVRAVRRGGWVNVSGTDWPTPSGCARVGGRQPRIVRRSAARPGQRGNSRSDRAL
jgi:hypothetical protein